MRQETTDRFAAGLMPIRAEVRAFWVSTVPPSPEVATRTDRISVAATDRVRPGRVGGRCNPLDPGFPGAGNERRGKRGQSPES